MSLQNLKAYEEFIDFITSAPPVEEIAQYYISPDAQNRVSELLYANANRRLTDAEFAELDDYEALEHIVRLAKIKAHIKLAERKRQVQAAEAAPK